MNAKRARDASHMSAASKASKSVALTVRSSSPKSVSTLDDPKQSKRFLEAARQAEADETQEGADRAFRLAANPSRKNPKSDRD